MSDGMTPEQCRAAQFACSKNLFDAIAELRRETKADIGLIRDAVQTIDRAVAKITVYFELSGETPRPHKRGGDAEDQSEQVHQRHTKEAALAVAEAARLASEKLTAASTAASEKVAAASEIALAKVTAAVVTARTTKNGNGSNLPSLPWRYVALAVGFILMVIALVASDRQYERMKKPLPLPSLVVTPK